MVACGQRANGAVAHGGVSSRGALLTGRVPSGKRAVEATFRFGHGHRRARQRKMPCAAASAAAPEAMAVLGRLFPALLAVKDSSLPIGREDTSGPVQRGGA